MPLQNRVLPTGEIVAVAARGLFMGNRGILHDDGQRLGRARWKGKAWICCVLQFKGRKRPVMAPGSWTALFFLDEAVALAAGHRPCAECRRADYNAFRAAWGGAAKAPEIDLILHEARLEGRGQRRFLADGASLPDGCFVLSQGQPHLIWGALMRPYAPQGYGPGIPCPDGVVPVLTPAPIVAVLRAGYRPKLGWDDA